MNEQQQQQEQQLQLQQQQQQLLQQQQQQQLPQVPLNPPHDQQVGIGPNPFGGNATGMASQIANEVATVTRQTDLPVFDAAKTSLWFIVVESVFENDRIRSEKVKYNRVLPKLPMSFLQKIETFLLSRPQAKDNCYELLKAEILAKSTDTCQEKIDKLCSGLTLKPKQKPSELLQEIRNVAGADVNDNLLEVIWLNRLSPVVAGVMAALDVPLNQKGAAADPVHAQTMIPQFNVSATKIAPCVQPQADPMLECLNNLTARFEAMEASLRQSRPAGRGNQHWSRPQSQSRRVNRSRSESQVRDGLCYYHRRFGDKARNCREGCTSAAKN